MKWDELTELFSGGKNSNALIRVEQAAIFSTVHGSRLYGFEHEGSDFDEFIVVEGDDDRATQFVWGEHDVTVMTFGKFYDLALTGRPQAVEALFAPLKQWGEASGQYRTMIEATRIAGGEAFAVYERTIRAFSYGDFKRRRHAARLWMNLTELRQSGICVPHLRPEHREWCAEVATRYHDDKLAKFLSVFKESE